MTTRTADRLDDWESRPFTGGYDELRTLADQSFSGAVTAGRATLCMLNGTVVGVLEGTIESFEDATGTIYEAPTPALPLLLVMQDRGDDVRAKYYSEETPLSEADKKLSGGGFTGYIELSENVLSGDYYVVYQGGKSMSVAFVGESEKLVTGDEAFRKADDEVGIYKVRQVDIDVVEIPEPEPEETDAATTATQSSGSGATDPAQEPDKAEADDSPEPATETDTEPRAEPDDQAEPARQQDEPTSSTGGSDDGTAREPGTASGQRSTGNEPARGDEQSTQSRQGSADSGRQASRQESQSAPQHRDGPVRDDQDQRPHRDRAQSNRDQGRDRQGDRGTAEQQTAPRESEPAQHGSERARQEESLSGRAEPEQSRRSPRDTSGAPMDSSGRDRRSRQHGQDPPRSDESHPDPAAGGGESGAESAEEPGELEVRSIPSVDPEQTWTEGDDTSTGGGFETQREERGGGRERSESVAGSTQPRTGTRGQQSRQQSGRRGDIRADLEDAEAEIATLERRLEELESERDDLMAERDDIQSERDQLQSELAELESELEAVRNERDELQREVEDLRETVTSLESRLEQAGEDAVTAETTLTPTEAIAGTNLFVRYSSKGDATLKSAYNGSADADDVNENLSLEYHTQFDSASTAVDGQPYEEFLVGTIHYRFVSWLIRKLLYEIRDTGHESALADLYDALPRIDRVELNGSVTVEYTEDGQEQRSQESFDIVVRDRMGNPLAVANINDDRAAATEDMMTNLVTAARRVGESNERLAGAFFVTSSFYDPDALDTASEATGGGLLSRDKRESFVRLSRKDGFHLCLVESRDGDFHLAVPEL